MLPSIRETFCTRSYQFSALVYFLTLPHISCYYTSFKERRKEKTADARRSQLDESLNPCCMSERVKDLELAAPFGELTFISPGNLTHHSSLQAICTCGHTLRIRLIGVLIRGYWVSWVGCNASLLIEQFKGKGKGKVVPELN
jgi:hypothetical protein